ncbi:MAG: hypothetical protein U0V74_14370 [Chitinophagales bacterium]
MKPFKTGITILFVFCLIFMQSCGVKRDCRGHIKHKLPNGVWI